tara:strand:- start:484 stop:1143 length:660 start_codon:yes stop_codon:yes gene_type:complete
MDGNNFLKYMGGDICLSDDISKDSFSIIKLDYVTRDAMEENEQEDEICLYLYVTPIDKSMGTYEFKASLCYAPEDSDIGDFQPITLSNIQIAKEQGELYLEKHFASKHGYAALNSILTKIFDSIKSNAQFATCRSETISEYDFDHISNVQANRCIAMPPVGAYLSNKNTVNEAVMKGTIYYYGLRRVHSEGKVITQVLVPYVSQGSWINVHTDWLQETT